MLTERIRDDGLIQLRCLCREDVGDKYLGWLRDPNVNRYLEIRHNPPTNVYDLMQYVDSVNNSPDNILFGIFLLDDTHIGNIKLGSINVINQRAEVGLLIGDKHHWGKGYGTRAIRLISDFAFHDLGLTRLTAGMYEPNQGSYRAFIKAGYHYEGTAQDYWQSEEKRFNQLWVGLTNLQQTTPLQTTNFREVKSLVFIGGGNLLLTTMCMARSKGFAVGAILAPRHAAEVLSEGSNLISALQEKNFSVYVAETAFDVNPRLLGSEFSLALALCFGPAWIFPESVRLCFSHGMLNFNGIPIPHYLGGAHYTWQILNNNRQAGCHIQQITNDLDCGDLLMSETFYLSQGASTPEDYFRENEDYAMHFLESFFDKLIAESDFQIRPFADVNIHRLYFPRLITTENGWIDWSWSGNQIIAFCRAFGQPYRGASTKLNGCRIYLKRVAFIVEPSHHYFHPFSTGLIVRCLEDSFFVAVLGGLLRVDEYEFDKQDLAFTRIREGDRFFTDEATLERARIYRPQISGNGNLTSPA